MTDIRVDPDQLRWAATEIEREAGEADGAARGLNLHLLVEGINPEYAAQLAGKVRSYGALLAAQVAPIINGVRDESAWLRELARRFEEADQASALGMERLWDSTKALITEYGESPFVPAWLLNHTHPPWIEEGLWMQLGMQERLAMLADLRRDWANFMANRTVASFREHVISADYLEEMFIIYLFGLPAHLFQQRQVTDRRRSVVTISDQTEAFLPDHELFTKPVLPNGARDYGFSHWQYQNLPETMRTARNYLPASIDETIWQDWDTRPC